MRWPAPLEVLLALNVGVFLLWAFGSARRMTRHFEVSPGSLPRRPWTLLTATVSHSDLYSLVGNLQVRSPCSALPAFTLPDRFSEINALLKLEMVPATAAGRSSGTLTSWCKDLHEPLRSLQAASDGCQLPKAPMRAYQQMAVAR